MSREVCNSIKEASEIATPVFILLGLQLSADFSLF